MSADTDQVLDRLRGLADRQVRDEMGPRYGIHTDKAFGMRMATMRSVARDLGTDHELALGLWETGWYEARTVACFVDDPRQVTPEQMDSWAADFDNWAIVDTVCMHLFDRTSHAWEKVDEWSASEAEFVLRACLALLWALALHNRDVGDEAFRQRMGLIETNASDERHLVHKAAAMALRAITKRRPSMASDVRSLAEKLAASEDRNARRIGRRALKEL